MGQLLHKFLCSERRVAAPLIKTAQALQAKYLDTTMQILAAAFGTHVIEREVVQALPNKL